MARLGPDRPQSVECAGPRGQWLICWIVADDIFILREHFANCIPISYVLILETVLVSPQLTENSPRLGTHVVIEEWNLLAIFDHWIAVFILAPAIVIYWLAETG